MIEEREIIHHALHGQCQVKDVLYVGIIFQGAILTPTTEEGKASLKLASLSDKPEFVENDVNLIDGA